MRATHHVLEDLAAFITCYGLHTGDQFAATGPHGYNQLDICAIAYVVAEAADVPVEFFTDELTSLAIIEASAPAMSAIRAISDVLDSSVCEDEIAPGMYVPNYIDHVSNWAATTPIGEKQPPTVDEVIGRILRAANTLATQTPTPRAA